MIILADPYLMNLKSDPNNFSWTAVCKWYWGCRFILFEEWKSMSRKRITWVFHYLSLDGKTWAFSVATKHLSKSVCPSICPFVHLPVCRSITPFDLPSYSIVSEHPMPCIQPFSDSSFLSHKKTLCESQILVSYIRFYTAQYWYIAWIHSALTGT